MQVITLQELEFDLDDIVYEVKVNRTHLKIEDNDIVLLPLEEYTILKDAYEEWAKTPMTKLDN